MPINSKELRNFMSHFATGVTVITTKDRNGQNYGITANAFTSVSLDPPLILVCIDKNANCYFCFEDTKLFAVNILSEGQENISQRFATKGIDKFNGVAWRISFRGLPLLEDAVGNLECSVVQSYAGGDHTIYLGDVLSATVTGSSPLLFFRGKYQRLS